MSDSSRMRGKKLRGRGRGKGTFRSRDGYSGFPSKGKMQEFEDDSETELDDEAEEGGSERSKMSLDPVEIEGNRAFDLLSRKVQLRKLVDELALKTVEGKDEYPEDTDDDGYQPPSTQERQQRRLEMSDKVREKGSSSGTGFAKGKSKPERRTDIIKGKDKPERRTDFSKGKKNPQRKENNAEVIEEEEVLRIIGELEKEVDTTGIMGLEDNIEADLSVLKHSDIADMSKHSEVGDESGLEDVSDADLGDVSEHVLSDFSQQSDVAVESEQSDTHKIGSSSIGVGTPGLETLEMKNIKRSFEDVKKSKEVGGLMKHGPYGRILIVGDSRLQVLKKSWPRLAYIQPQFLIEPQLRLDGLKEYILSQTDLPKLENGTLLLCCVGLHDIINFTDYSDCQVKENHKCVKIMTLNVVSEEDLFRIALMKVKNAYKVMEEALDKRSVVCFTAIIPCDPVKFLKKELKNQTPKGHIVPSSEFMDDQYNLKTRLSKLCGRVNKHLKKLILMPSVWNIMSTYHRKLLVHGSMFCDGINVSYQAGEKWSFRLNNFFQELIYKMRITNKFIEFNQDQEIIIVGDSRFLELQKMWCGDKPTFYCESELGFYNFEEYILKNFIGLKNKVVLVCLGLNDLIQFSDDDECFGKDHEPNKVIVSICERYETVKEYLEKISNNVENCFKAFSENNSSLLLFATVYPFLLDTHMTTNIEVHKEKTGHDISHKPVNPEVNKNLNDLVHLLNSHLKSISKKLGLPTWDMHHVVCRGCEPSELSKTILEDGINPSKRTIEELNHSYFRFVNEKLRHNYSEDVAAYQFDPRPLMELDDDTKNVEEKSDQDWHSKEEEENSNQDWHSREEPENGAALPGHGSASHHHLRETDPSHGSERSSSIEFRNQRLYSPSHGSRTKGFSYERMANYESGYTNSSASGHQYLKDRVRDFRDFRYEERTYHGRYSRSPESFSNRRSRSPERTHNYKFSRSPDRYYNVPKHSRSVDKDFRRSPERGHNYRFSRSPDRYYHMSKHSRSVDKDFRRSPERGHSSSWQQSSYEHSKYGGSVPQRFSKSRVGLGSFKEFFRMIKSQCHRERERVISDALLDLCDTHKRECERYLEKPYAHPDYSKEYWQFVEKKKTYIQELGGNVETYNYLEDWKSFWPTRMLELFNQSWLEKKHQCISMISSKKRRASSSSSSSSSSSYSSRSSSSPHRKRKRSKGKSSRSKKNSKHFRSVSPDVSQRSAKWKPVGSSSPNSVDDDGFIKQKTKLQKDKKKIDIVLQTRNIVEPLVDKKQVKLVEVLGILAYMKDKLGVYGMPVTVLYEKAMSLEKKREDPNLLLKDEETVAVLNMVNNKLSSSLGDREGSTIQNAITQEAQTLLSQLLKEVSQRKKSSSNMTVNTSRIARLTLGKSSVETIKTIESFLLYEGFSDLSKENIEGFYIAVKNEQFKLNNSHQESLSDVFPGRKSPKRRELLDYSKPPPYQNFLSTEDELTEEFFIGQKSFSKPGQQSVRPSPSGASTSGYNPGIELDEEFFTGKKFKKPNFSDPVSHDKSSYASKSSYISHKHVIPPPAPLISGVQFSRNSDTTTSVSQGPNIDFDMMRKCLETLKNIHQ